MSMNKHITFLLTFAVVIFLIGVGVGLALVTIKHSFLSSLNAVKSVEVGGRPSPCSELHSSISSTSEPTSCVSIVTTLIAKSRVPKHVGVVSSVLMVRRGYGGNFSIVTLNVTGSIGGRICGASRESKINVTVWSPFGREFVHVLTIDFTRNGSSEGGIKYSQGVFEGYGEVGRHLSVEGQVLSRGGWVYIIFRVTPSWEVGGSYDLLATAYDLINGFSSTLYVANGVTFVNTTEIINLRLDKYICKISEPYTVSGKVVYYGTRIGVRDELVINETVVPVSPNGTFSYTFEAPSKAGDYRLILKLRHGLKVYLVNFTVVSPIMNLTLIKGWNLVSLPLATTLNPLAGDVVIAMYKWDPILMAYVEVDELRPGEGYWILAEHNKSITIVGQPLTRLEVNLSRGWNLIGSIACKASVSLPNGTNLMLYRWDSKLLCYEEVYTVKPFEGVWVYSLNPTKALITRA